MPQKQDVMYSQDDIIDIDYSWKNMSLYQILCKLFNFRIPSQIYLKQASSF